MIHSNSSLDGDESYSEVQTQKRTRRLPRGEKIK